MDALQVKDRYDGVSRQDQILLVIQYLGRPVTAREIAEELFIEGCNGLTLATANATIWHMKRNGTLQVDASERSHRYYVNLP